MDLSDFEKIVDETLDELPKEFAAKMENVGIVVEDWPTEFEFQQIKAHPKSLIFGLYRGIPKTQRRSNYSALPDKITIFIGPILLISKTLEQAKAKIRETVLHEIGHHFGLTDEQIYRAMRV